MERLPSVERSAVAIAWVRLAVVTETWTPVARMDVECFNLNQPFAVIDVVQTDKQGVALFTGLPDNQRYFFKPRGTRSYGKYGPGPGGPEHDEANPNTSGVSLAGQLRIQILASSGATCADFIVDPSGNFGTHTTIQAALTAAGALTGTSPPVLIFIMGGTYIENLTIPAMTRELHLVGCGTKRVEVLSSAFETVAGLGTPDWGVAVQGTLTYSGVVLRPSVTLEGLYFSSGNASATIIAGAGGLRFIECAIEQTGAVGTCFDNVPVSGLDWLELLDCVMVTARTQISLPDIAARYMIRRCYITGRVIIPANVENSVIFENNIIQGETAAEPVVNIDSGNLVAGGGPARIINNYIKQYSATGHGIQVGSNGAACADGPTIIVANHIEGAGGGTAILWDDNSVYGLAEANAILNWATGITVVAGNCVIVLGNQYTTVTTPVSGTPASLVSGESPPAGLAASFVTLAATADLANERVLTGSASVLVTDNGAGSTVVLSVIAAAVDHGGLLGLADDDHLQYLLLAGRGVEQDIVGGVTISTYGRIGSNATPTNTTAGDLTALRLFITNAALNSEARLVQIQDAYTPAAGAFNSMYVLTNVTPGAGVASDEIRAAKFETNIRPTDNHAGAVYGFYSEADHDSGAFNVGEMFGFFGQAFQSVALSTITTAYGGRVAYRITGGTITTAIGMDVVRGLGGDAGTITTGIGVRIQASAGVAPGTDIALQVLGAGAHSRFQGSVVIGADASPAAANGSLTLLGQLVATPSAAQNITAVGATILANAAIVQLTADASYTLTSAPTIANGQDGQILIIMNVDTVDTITIQDQGTLALSNLRLSATTIALAPRDSIILVYSSTVGDWVQIGQTNVI